MCYKLLILQIVNIGPAHTCASTSRMQGKEASTAWICDRAKDLIIRTPALRPKDLHETLQTQFNIDLSYNKVWAGMKKAKDELHGTWEQSFKMLWGFKAALEEACPRSIVEIDCKKVGGQIMFSRMFVAIRACVDGFLVGCRPYLGVDSTHLTGRYNEQLAAATAIDGHNWMYPMAYGIFYRENTSNWSWFMTLLKRAIGTPQGLTIHTDACKGLEDAVATVFGNSAEHRECFRHLMSNFRKKFKGDVLKYMWPCAWACRELRHQQLIDSIATTCPQAIPYLKTYHKHLWSRAQFSRLCKVDYVNNNISECFNSWIKDLKDLPVVDLMNKIREKIMQKIYTRSVIADNLHGRILPSVIQELHQKSRGLHYTIQRSTATKAQVKGPSKGTGQWGFCVDLETKTCSCGQWDVSGKPCTHAIAFIGSIRKCHVELFVDNFYSVERFKAMYEFAVNPLDDKSQWPLVDPGFDMRPPKLETSAGRPRKRRIESSGEPGKRGPYQCKRCFQFGHIERTCDLPQAEPNYVLPALPPRRNK